MIDNELNKTSFYFEIFMERANGKNEAFSVGFYTASMINLIVAEKGKVVSIETLIRFERQLIEIKGHIEEALEKYIAKPQMNSYTIDELKRCKEQVVWAISSDELMKIVFHTIDLTASIPIEMSY